MVMAEEDKSTCQSGQGFGLKGFSDVLHIQDGEVGGGDGGAAAHPTVRCRRMNVLASNKAMMAWRGRRLGRLQGRWQCRRRGRRQRRRPGRRRLRQRGRQQWRRKGRRWRRQLLPQRQRWHRPGRRQW